jgi:membrane protein YqaA with SNARE-associated domain
MTAPTPKTETNWKLNAARVGIVLALIAITALFYFFRNQVQALQRFGYPGLFALNVIASGSIVLPIPALPIVFGMAAIKTTAGWPVFSWFWLGVAAALGATIGELSGYGAGFSGQALFDQTGVYERLHHWTERYGVITLAVLAFIPNPLFDMAGIAAGTLKMPIWKFLIATFVGKLFKMWLVAWAGANSIEWITQFFF